MFYFYTTCIAYYPARNPGCAGGSAGGYGPPEPALLLASSCPSLSGHRDSVAQSSVPPHAAVLNPSWSCGYFLPIQGRFGAAQAGDVQWDGGNVLDQSLAGISCIPPGLGRGMLTALWTQGTVLVERSWKVTTGGVGCSAPGAGSPRGGCGHVPPSPASTAKLHPRTLPLPPTATPHPTFPPQVIALLHQCRWSFS